MKIRLVGFSDWGRAGDVLDVDANDALKLIRSHQAEQVDPPKTTTREAARNTGKKTTRSGTNG